MKKLRKVIDLVDKFLPEDHNDHVDNWNKQISICRGWTRFYPEIESLFNQLESLVSSMRYVKYGDYYYANEHNLFVRAWKKLIEIDRVVASYAPEFSQIEKIVGQMSEIKPGDFYLAMHHNLFADAWKLQEQINAAILKMPPAMTQIYVEDWGYGGIEQMGKVYYEDWSYAEPPAMTLVFKEEWSG